MPKLTLKTATAPTDAVAFANAFNNAFNPETSEVSLWAHIGRYAGALDLCTVVDVGPLKPETADHIFERAEMYLSDTPPAPAMAAFFRGYTAITGITPVWVSDGDETIDSYENGPDDANEIP